MVLLDMRKLVLQKHFEIELLKVRPAMWVGASCVTARVAERKGPAAAFGGAAMNIHVGGRVWQLFAVARVVHPTSQPLQGPACNEHDVQVPIMRQDRVPHGGR